MFYPPKFGIGTVTGIVGAITGPAGCVIGWISYRRSQQIKTLDLRLELRREILGVRVEIEALSSLLERAQMSRSAVSAAMGIGQQSSANQIWKVKWENDVKALRCLARELPDAKETYERSKPKELENKLVEIHALAAKAAQLRNRYETALASDDKDRDRIRSDARSRKTT